MFSESQEDKQYYWGKINGLNYFMGAREDQIKRLFIITKLRDELVYWCKINGKKLFYVGKRGAKLTDKLFYGGKRGAKLTDKTI